MMLDVARVERGKVRVILLSSQRGRTLKVRANPTGNCDPLEKGLQPGPRGRLAQEEMPGATQSLVVMDRERELGLDRRETG